MHLELSILSFPNMWPKLSYHPTFGELACCPVSGQSPIEERLNILTHVTGLILSMTGLILLVGFASLTGDSWSIVGSTVFACALILVYMASTIYHACTSFNRLSVYHQCTVQPTKVKYMHPQLRCIA